MLTRELRPVAASGFLAPSAAGSERAPVLTAVDALTAGARRLELAGRFSPASSRHGYERFTAQGLAAPARVKQVLFPVRGASVSPELERAFYVELILASGAARAWVISALDGRVLAFAAIVSLAAALLSGWIPALRASSFRLPQSLASESRGSAGASSSGPRRLLTVVELMLAVVLVAGAFLMLRSVARLLDLGLEPFLVTAALEGIIAQRLVRRICANCKTEYTPAEEQLMELELRVDDVVGKKFWYGKGCEICNNTGYKGRQAICELLDLTDHIREMILEKRPTSEIKKAAREDGMRFLREAAVERVFEGLTTLREINKVTFVE